MKGPFSWHFDCSFQSKNSTAVDKMFGGNKMLNDLPPLPPIRKSSAKNYAVVDSAEDSNADQDFNMPGQLDFGDEGRARPKTTERRTNIGKSMHNEDQTSTLSNVSSSSRKRKTTGFCGCCCKKANDSSDEDLNDDNEEVGYDNEYEHSIVNNHEDQAADESESIISIKAQS